MVRASPTKSAPSKGLQASAERRPITVMFCDLVGSTSLAAKLDAEDWRNLVNAYLDEASAAVTGLGGHVLKKLGDGLMALFGYPHAQENDAERAVRAALAIQRALVEINARNASKGAPELSARIGLDCGQVGGRRNRRSVRRCAEYRRAGPSAAEPGSVLITASVQRQTAGLFVAEEKGAHELKGVSPPMSLYRVVRASGGGRRGGARALTPLVGREEELDLLTPALGARAQRRGPTRADRRRARPRQVEADGGVSRAVSARRRTPGSNGRRRSCCRTRRCIRSPNGAGSASARICPPNSASPTSRTLCGLIGLDPAEYAPLLAPLVDVLLPEDRVGETRAGGVAAPATGGDDGMDSGGRADASSRARLRGPALGRPDFARSHARAGRARGAGAVAHHRDDAAGVPPALERALAP